MSDLSNLLGDLYGDSSNPDGPPVRREPAAAERAEWAPARSDDDLAAALSAALAEPAPTPAPAPAPPVMPQIPAPAAPAAWTAAPEPMPAPEAHVPSVSVSMPMATGPRMWAVGDDDILPMGGGKRKR